MGISAGRTAAEMLALARQLGPLLDGEARQGELEAAVTAKAAEALSNAGFLRIQVPKSFGGDQLAYVAVLKIFEELARADGSVAWLLRALVQHAGLFSTLLPDSGAKALFAEPAKTPAIAGMPAPLGKAERVEGGYEWVGRYGFASGSTCATHFTAGALVVEGGEPVLADNGEPLAVCAVIPREDVRELGNWEVYGMEATASIDYEIGPLFVSDDFVVPLTPFPTRLAREGSPSFKLGPKIALPTGHSAIMLGLAQRALEEVALLAPSRRRLGMPSALSDQSLFRHDLVLRHAELTAVRELFYVRMTDAEESVTGDKPGPLDAVRSDRCTQVARHLHDVAIRCVNFAHEWAGSSALRRGTIGRVWKNANAANTHAVLDRNNLVDAASTILEELATGAKHFMPATKSG
ncbi:acyl-CoA dehydrogenase family protein [Saccharopolyspora phatthalungensis]|uniref:Alkylation response protein AidB-like acyl-CoA dehydrogenase n=1 Tax=Saccharopolyspora phatthalungensis TaxID=664693 RepID=A0A840QJ36_9PSEU|nr:acyl-CoA dehydrogenase family protein [Saccharopolyspora phatthalungensis]MBB5158869.1 alkylation response protein AidB-like acyl-CoA dehydrogenase [Saccharopolyspora phatthalungensis]